MASISNALMMTISGRVLTQKLDAVRYIPLIWPSIGYK
jgi:hypothetical protein